MPRNEDKMMKEHEREEKRTRELFHKQKLAEAKKAEDEERRRIIAENEAEELHLKQ